MNFAYVTELRKNTSFHIYFFKTTLLKYFMPENIILILVSPLCFTHAWINAQVGVGWTQRPLYK